jgi:hypothetical protein
MSPEKSLPGRYRLVRLVSLAMDGGRKDDIRWPTAVPASCRLTKLESAPIVSGSVPHMECWFMLMAVIDEPEHVV